MHMKKVIEYSEDNVLSSMLKDLIRSFPGNYVDAIEDAHLTLLTKKCFKASDDHFHSDFVEPSFWYDHISITL